VPAPLTGSQAHKLWFESDARIEVMAARVREGREVMAASEFARWLQFSGVVELLEPYEAGFPLPVRALELKDKTKRLVASCNEWFADHERSNTRPEPTVPRSELEAIHEQLRNINAALHERTTIQFSQVAT